ncbi:MAG: 4Fe-4S dicluster-binding protein [Candidatus Omnitrophota bacterium]
MSDKKAGWKELPIGAVLKAGTAFDYKTGSWRSFRPIWLEEKCIHCLQCWLVCPDCAIAAKEGKFGGYDYDHCKGCGLCAYICPVKGKAIKMVKETEAGAEIDRLSKNKKVTQK